MGYHTEQFVLLERTDAETKRSPAIFRGIFDASVAFRGVSGADIFSHSTGPIDTISGGYGSSFISSFGVLHTATYGQTMTVSSGASTLNSFSFEIGYCGAAVTFRGEVYAWDGSKATGAALYEISPQTLANTASFQKVTFNTGGISLAAGRYVLMRQVLRRLPPGGC